MMRFPILKVRDVGIADSQPEHIVGTNSHDSLHIDSVSGGIQYLNLQCCGSTENYPQHPGTYQFVGTANEYSPYPEIEFVTFDELCKIYLETTRNNCECEKNLRELIKNVTEKHDEIVSEYGFNSPSENILGKI